jgi:hypothetical protein
LKPPIGQKARLKMKRTVNEADFRDTFRMYERGNLFSHAGLGALFEWLEQGEEMELDVIGLCRKFAEYSSAKEAADQYDNDLPNNPDTVEAAAREWLAERTTVIDVPGGGVIIHRAVLNHEEGRTDG